MNPEEFRAALRDRTPEAIAAVRWVLRTSQDPSTLTDALEYLDG